ncbi:MAG: ion transporter, partial [Eggerthella sp.]|nr:ion transporter [Eggerthella sp.]
MGAARRNAGHAGGARDAKRAPRRAPSAFKREAYFALEDVRRGNAVARIVGIALFALIVANAILVFAETQPGIPAGVSAALLAFGLASSVCFGLEYAARLWTADLVHPDASPARARMRYALSPMGIIDLLAFAPGLLVLFVPVTAAGRLVGFCTMLLSIGVVAIPAGIFSAGFVSEFRAQDARDR